MTEYVPPPPAVAEQIHQSHVESTAQHERMQSLSTDELKVVVLNREESTPARGNALLALMMSNDGQLCPDVQLPLLGDPDKDIRRSAIRAYARTRNDQIRDRLVELMSDADDTTWSSAAVALSHAQDLPSLNAFDRWLQVGDREHRNVAIECLKSYGEEGQTRLQQFWDSDAGDAEDRLVVAMALLSLEDSRGLSMLHSTAESCCGAWSVASATSIYISNDRRQGLQLMLRIIDDGDLEAKQSMVSQIWNFTKLPHAFTADGIHEARCWVETELAAQAT